MSLSSSVEHSISSTTFLKKDEFLVILRPSNSAVILGPLACVIVCGFVSKFVQSLFFVVKLTCCCLSS